MADATLDDVKKLVTYLEGRVIELDHAVSSLGGWYRRQEGRLGALERYHMLPNESEKVAMREKWRMEQRKLEPKVTSE